MFDSTGRVTAGRRLQSNDPLCSLSGRLLSTRSDMTTDVETLHDLASSLGFGFKNGNITPDYTPLRSLRQKHEGVEKTGNLTGIASAAGCRDRLSDKPAASGRRPDGHRCIGPASRTLDSIRVNDTGFTV